MPEIMKLNECEAGKTYTVCSVELEQAVRGRLYALGVGENTTVTILNRKLCGSVMIRVRGTRLALGRKITEGIEIRRAKTIAER